MDRPGDDALYASYGERSASGPSHLDLDAVLQEHGQDAHQALASLLKDFNQLAAAFQDLSERHEALQGEHGRSTNLNDKLEKDLSRSVRENAQLWKSLKGRGSGPGSTSSKGSNDARLRKLGDALSPGKINGYPTGSPLSGMLSSPEDSPVADGTESLRSEPISMMTRSQSLDSHAGLKISTMADHAIPAPAQMSPTLSSSGSRHLPPPPNERLMYSHNGAHVGLPPSPMSTGSFQAQQLRAAAKLPATSPSLSVPQHSGKIYFPSPGRDAQGGKMRDRTMSNNSQLSVASIGDDERTSSSVSGAAHTGATSRSASPVTPLLEPKFPASDAAPSSPRKPRERTISAPTGVPRDGQVADQLNGDMFPLQPSALRGIEAHIPTSVLRETEFARDSLVFAVHLLRRPEAEDAAPQAAHGLIEKLSTDFFALDASLRAGLSKHDAKIMPPLPDKALFKDHSPQKVEHRRALLEQYLQSVLAWTLSDGAVLCAFFNSTLPPAKPSSFPESKAGYLTKRGRTWGSWHTRHYVLAKGVLSYYDTLGGTKVGEIRLNGAQIGRQSSRSDDTPSEDAAYTHAFLIRTAARRSDGPEDFILCAMSDAERDEWVAALTGTPRPSGHGHRFDSFDSPEMQQSPSNRSMTPSGSLPMDLHAAARSPPREREHTFEGIKGQISGPTGGTVIGADFKKRDLDEKKARTKSFWGGFQRDKDAAQMILPGHNVFGVPLAEAVAVSRVRPGLDLPAVVFRSIEYLEAKRGITTEGLYRINGSAAEIKALKERFNHERDVNLVASTDMHDIHAVAGLLKQFLRDLPSHLLTRELRTEFMEAMEIPDEKDKVDAIRILLRRLPPENYTLFKYFFAHLCAIAQEHATNRMNVRNIGIVFSPTLQIPQPLLSLFLAEFDTLFSDSVPTHM